MLATGLHFASEYTILNMLIIIAESSKERFKLSRHPANAGLMMQNRVHR